ncbi:somatostatin receptor type 2 [Anabrus simplex]|uniref:somatostatin receptor type 2 n=1 Tax=Anabrus simplex TaxID=316456 RepID=UPI0035A2F27C
MCDNSSFCVSYNATSNTSAHECKMELPVMICFTQVLYSFVCIAGLLGNTLVIYVVLRFSKMQTVTNMYIANLAIADECFLIGIPFLLATMSLNMWPFGKLMCKAYMTTTSINQFTSSIFLTVLSVDRYIAICHPVSSPKIRTLLLSRTVTLTAWLLSCLLVVPVFIYSSTLERNSTIVCAILWPESDRISGETAFTLYSFTLGFGIPLFLIMIFYYLVVKKLRSVGPKNKSKERIKTHKKVTKLVLTVITVYVLCWLPYWVTQIFLIFTPARYCHSKLSVTIFVLAGCLSYSNSAVNPVLYAFLSDNFRKGFLKACACTHEKDIKFKMETKNVNKVFTGIGHSRSGGSSIPLVRINQDGIQVSRGEQCTGTETAM